jgi:hypothetical protein
MNTDRAIEFIRKNGNRFEQARLDHTLGLGFDPGSVMAGFSQLQNPDGGFPYADEKGFPSCLSNTTMALHTLLELELVNEKTTKLTIGFFKKMQKDNGTWEENEKVKPLNPPFWDMPGDEKTTIWLTADVADLLQRSGNPVPKKTIDYLAGLQGPTGRLKGFYHATWIALSVFGRKGHYNRKIWSGALAFLESEDISDWDASCIAWCLDSMKHGGVGKSSKLWDKLKSQLSATQEQDGGWPSEGGETMRPRDANSILSALMGID